jgi:hypothetical protein
MASTTKHATSRFCLRGFDWGVIGNSDERRNNLTANLVRLVGIT